MWWWYNYSSLQMWGSLQQTLGSTPSPWSRTSKCTRVRSTRFSIIPLFPGTFACGRRWARLPRWSSSTCPTRPTRSGGRSPPTPPSWTRRAKLSRWRVSEFLQHYDIARIHTSSLCIWGNAIRLRDCIASKTLTIYWKPIVSPGLLYHVKYFE